MGAATVTISSREHTVVLSGFLINFIGRTPYSILNFLAGQLHIPHHVF